MRTYEIPFLGGPIAGQTRAFLGELPACYDVTVKRGIDSDAYETEVYDLQELRRPVPSGFDVRFAYVFPGTHIQDVLKAVFPPGGEK